MRGEERARLAYNPDMSSQAGPDPTRSPAIAVAVLGLLHACAVPPTPTRPMRGGATDVELPTSTPAPPDQVASSDDASVPEPSTYRTSATRDGGMLVSWRSIPDPLPVGELCELEVLVQRADDGSPVTGAAIHVRGQMPAHGHGMNLTPRATELGEGRYRVRGMLLHMAGHWEVGIDVVLDDLASSAEFELELE